ncbi:MAG: hypothetical protein ACRDHD_05485 [Candidatus Limnocylindria bacterium]
MYGALALARPISPDASLLAEIPGDQFGLARDEPNDWGSATQDALERFSRPPSPEPVPINVWTPDRQSGRHVQIRLSFSDTCPEQRFIALVNDATRVAAATLYVGGSTAARGDFTLPLTGQWSVALVGTDGAVLNATGLDPLGFAVGTQITGALRCSDGKGVFKQEGIPQQIPNPSGTSSLLASRPPPSPPISRDEKDAAQLPAVVWIAPVAGLAVALAAVALVARSSRRRRAP